MSAEAGTRPELKFSVMGMADLDAVAAAESELHAFPWSRGNFSDSLSSGHWAWLAHAGDALAGYAVVMPVVDEAHLLDISVLRSWQGRGCAGVFLDFLLRRAREEGMKTMLLEVRPSNQAALGLYRRAGFLKIGLRRGYYPAMTGREDAIVMARSLE